MLNIDQKLRKKKQLDCELAQMLNLEGKNFKGVIITMFKELKEMKLKELKDGMMILVQ